MAAVETAEATNCRREISFAATSSSLSTLASFSNNFGQRRAPATGQK
jgi:hypothetical protein